MFAVGWAVGAAIGFAGAKALAMALDITGVSGAHANRLSAFIYCLSWSLKEH